MTKEFRCRNHRGIAAMFCQSAGACPFGGESSDRTGNSFAFNGHGTVPKGPVYGNVYRAPTEAQRRVAENTSTEIAEEQDN